MTIAGSLPLVVQTRADVLAILPFEYRRALAAPVRDALADSLLALLLRAQDAGDYAASQCDPGRATGTQQDALFEERGVPRAVGEPDDSFRDRALAAPRLVTFSAIRDAANAILEPFTAVRCAISDMTLDRWFLGVGTPRAWSSHLNLNNSTRGPNYVERYFEDNVPQNTGGLFVEGNKAGGARLGEGTHGREFLLRVPDLAGLVDAKVTPGEGGDPAAHVNGFFLGDGSYPLSHLSGSLVLNALSGGQHAETVYEAVASTVNALVSHSVRWTLIADPKLT